MDVHEQEQQEKYQQEDEAAACNEERATLEYLDSLDGSSSEEE